MKASRILKLLLLILFLSTNIYAQEETPWYKEMPRKAELSADGLSMKIGDKQYGVNNAYSPIAPKGGEQVIYTAGVLDYYMWMHKKPDGLFTISKIDMELNIYYYDEELGGYYSPDGKILDEK